MIKTGSLFLKKLLSFMLVLGLLSVVFIFAACESTSAEDSIFGKYNYESVAIQANPEEDWMQPAAEGSSLTLKDDLSGIFVFQGQNIGFDYSRVGNNITAHIVFRGESKIWYGVLNGGKLTLDIRFNSYVMLKVVYQIFVTKD